jgi:hypothetical protein
LWIASKIDVYCIQNFQTLLESGSKSAHIPAILADQAKKIIDYKPLMDTY